MATLLTAPTASKLRDFREEDAAAIVRVAEHKAEQLGCGVWVPPLATARQVFVLEENGQVKGAMIFKDVVEMSLIGDHPRMVRRFMANEDKIRAVLDRRGVTEMISFVPQVLMNKDRVSGMQAIMRRLRFRRIDQEFAAFEGRVYE